ncbi:Large cysteine-rich periplasmic protein OmcB precursor [Planctomycetes bacterium MalM25]|nr:Large cysteine-rich periplasmic protein OmcB precursor [Planctomycetes bacterium MalM25]
MLRYSSIVAVCFAVLAPVSIGAEKVAPWSAGSASPGDDPAAVAEWAENAFAQPRQQAAQPTAPTQLKVTPLATPTPSTFAPVAPPAGGRYGEAAPTPAPFPAPPVNTSRLTRPNAAPLPHGNPLRGGARPVTRLESGSVSSKPAAVAAFEPARSAPTAEPPQRLEVGATPARRQDDEAVAIPPQAFAPAPVEPSPRPAPRQEPLAPPRVALNTMAEPAAFETTFEASSVVTQQAVREGMGRPGPQELEGPQEASLVLEKRGPREARIGQPCRFAVRVRNTGTGDAENVMLTDQVPAGARLISTNPNAQQEGDRLVWRLGKIPSGETRTVEMRIEPTQEGPLGSVARATLDTVASASTVCTRPQLAVRMSAPQHVLVGEEQIITIELHNPGTGAATNVMLSEDVPAALRHAAGAELEFEVGTLEPGETRRIDLRMTAAAAGRVRNLVNVVADGDLRAEESVEFEVVAPSLAVTIDGPKRRYLESQASYTIGVDNPGTAPARDVRLVSQLPRGMEFVRANNLGEYDATTHSVYWSLAELPEGERGEVKLVATPVAAGEHTLKVESEAAGLKAAHSHRVQVEGVASLAFEVRDLKDPIEVGEEALYEIRVLNEGTKAATGVTVRVESPSGMRMVAAQGQTTAQTSAGRAEFAPLAKLEPGEKVAYRVRVAGVESGDQRVTVLVDSDDLTRPIRREESTRVYGDE